MPAPLDELRTPLATSPHLSERRRFLAWAAGVAALSACRQATDSILGPRALSTIRPSRVESHAVNVRDAGAQGDGVADDTESFARAISTLGSDGGTLVVPDGDYRIDPLRSVRLTDNVALKMSSGAVLRALPVAAANSAVVLIERARNVQVSGGTIVGDRREHLGTRGEGGMGVWVSESAHIRIENVLAQDCWGDGFYIAGRGAHGSYDPNSPVESHSEDVTISHCSARNNRRQGLSIVGCVGALVENSEFTGTNGTAPEAGIDLEPQRNWIVTDITVRNCVAARNAGCGILVCGNDIYNGMVTRVLLEGNQATDNRADGVRIMRASSYCTLSSNVLVRNQGCGLAVERSHHNDVVSNVLRRNSQAAPNIYPDILVENGSTYNTILNNQSQAQNTLFVPEKPTVVITSDCTHNVVEYDRVPSSGPLSGARSCSPTAPAGPPSGCGRRGAGNP